MGILAAPLINRTIKNQKHLSKNLQNPNQIL